MTMEKYYRLLRPVITAAVLIILSTIISHAQVKIGLPAGTAAASAVLDASNTGGGNKGFLAPQVALTALNAAGPVSSPAAGLLVYNTATAGSSPNNVVPGYYYWNGTQWVAIVVAASTLTGGNIYANDGTLAGNRTVTQGASNLTFSSTTGNLVFNPSSTGSLGIGTPTPSAKLDVNGGARIRTINQVAPATTPITPLFVDGSGNIVKSSAAATFGSTSAASSASLANGASGTLTTNFVDGGIYKAFVYVGDACGDGSVAEYYITAFSANSYFAINGLGGIVASGTPTKSPTFVQTSRTVIVTTWTGKVGCSGGDNSTSLNYTLTISFASPTFTLTVANNGNIAKNYSIVLTKIN
jgi:hypothetical protein